MVTDSRAAEVEGLLQRCSRWAEQRIDVRALALVGSWARGAPEMESDVDLVLLTEVPSVYIEREDWFNEFGRGQLMRTLTWGAITERRFRLTGGLEVEFGVGTPAWAAVDALDDGTRKVVSDGMRVLYDPDLLLTRLAAAAA